MSVTATVDRPQNDDELAFDLPVCTEALYRELIFPIAEANDLSLIDNWGIFVRVNSQNKELFFEQLNILLKHILKSDVCDWQKKNHIKQRLETLVIEIDRMLSSRSDIDILVG